MENIVMLFAMAQPLLDGAVVVPTVIARQGFNGQHIRIIKNLQISYFAYYLYLDIFLLRSKWLNI